MNTAIETTAYISALLISAILVLSGALSLTACIWISLFLFTSLLYIAWRRFDGGRHPCFLFLVLLLLFQMGRLFGYALGAVDEPFNIVVQTLMPFHISVASAEITMLIILLSATCIYAVCAWNVRSVVLSPGWEQKWLPACYVMLGASFPFVVYKNLQYFMFIRSHGGYLAIFTDSEGVANSAGSVVRIMSLIAYNAFILVYVMERRRKLLAVVTCLFLLTTVLELAIGLRGKVFLFLLTLWFVRNLKTGKGFRLITMGAVGVLGSIAAVAISGFREMRSAAVLGPAQFLTVQGISLGVTEIAVEYRNLFRPHALTYMANEILGAFYPGSHFGQGQLFDNDLSVFLNADAYRLGFGTGSSYLAEAYLVGGIFAVVCASVLVGLGLRQLHTMGKSFLGAVIVAILLPSVIYLPRAELLGPLSSALKKAATFLLMVPCLWLIRFVFYGDDPLSDETAVLSSDQASDPL
jgi:hypothetical protein